ncbi:hypothetical protein CLCR_06434 [Cladophialophora carrionii]|uniref:Uncharacterized protein n=1 Tax=Cladophialophora carrionii TaxID=86049 RepID=A0A1C1C8I9_9EURO|nr:hypothetical protein CLCR_06434 [Cladophialophora carrionii]
MSFARVVGVLRPNDTTICDYYTPLILGKENTSANELELMALITHTFSRQLHHSYGIKVDGTVGPRTLQGHDINLLPYFTGGYVSSNDVGKASVVNFLDDGGATARLTNKPADTNNSNQ